MIQQSGFRIQFDPDRARGRRISSAYLNGERIRQNAIYKIATIDYLAEGKDGLKIFKKQNIKQLNLTIDKLFLNHIIKVKNLKLFNDQRTVNLTDTQRSLE